MTLVSQSSFGWNLAFLQDDNLTINDDHVAILDRIDIYRHILPGSRRWHPVDLGVARLTVIKPHWNLQPSFENLPCLADVFAGQLLRLHELIEVFLVDEVRSGPTCGRVPVRFKKPLDAPVTNNSRLESKSLRYFNRCYWHLSLPSPG